MKRILCFVVLIAIALTAVACAKSSTSTGTSTSTNAGTTVSYDTVTGKWTLPKGWKATETPVDSQDWVITNSKGINVARYHIDRDGSRTLTEIPGVSFNEAKKEWTLPNHWTAIEINSKVWNIFDQNNHLIVQYEIQFDGSLKIAESDYDPSTSYL